MKFSSNEIKERGAIFSPEAFKRPATDYYPAFAWSWCDPIDRDEVMRQLDYMCENNIKIVYILPEPKDFRPKTAPTNLEPDYLSEEYFEIYRFAAEYAAKLGMQLWLYDEGGWPSGSANHRVVKDNPHLRNIHIEKREVSSPYNPNEDAVAAYCDGKRVEKGFETSGTITEYFRAHSAWEPEYPNMCEKDATDYFIKLTHENYKRHMGDMLGNQIKIAFTDEPAISAVGWFYGIEDRFKEKYGYDILDFLPYLLEREEAPEEAKKARIDYENLLGEAFCESYFLPLRSWCRENGIMSSGHLGGEDEFRNCNKHGFIHALRQLRALDIPGIDTIWRQIFPGKKNTAFPRLASSAANQIGSPYAVSESFSIYSHGFTFEQMRYVMNYQMIRGINLINIMLTTYSFDGVGRIKGGPCFSPLMPNWKALGEYNMYTARMSYLMCLGKSDIKYALYMPMNDFWAGGDAMEPAFESFENTAWELEKRHCPFDFIDDDFLETCALKNGVLSTGNAEYSTIIVPHCARMPENSRKMLEKFAQGGGKVIYPDALDTLEPACEISDPEIMVHKKRFDGSTIYLIANEAAEKRTFTLSLPESGYIYLADAQSGNLYAASAHGSVTLASGESVVYIATDKKYTALPLKTADKPLAIQNHFEMRPTYRFMMGTTHFETELPDEPFVMREPCDWCSLYGKSFSGTVQYRIKFTLDQIPEKGIIIDMGDVRHTVKLKINGQDAGTRFATPYTFNVPKQVLYYNNEIVAEVSNTPGNEFCQSRIFETIPPNVIGSYRRIVAQYEGETVESGLLTPVTIYSAK